MGEGFWVIPVSKGKCRNKLTPNKDSQSRELLTCELMRQGTLNRNRSGSWHLDLMVSRFGRKSSRFGCILPSTQKQFDCKVLFICTCTTLKIIPVPRAFGFLAGFQRPRLQFYTPVQGLGFGVEGLVCKCCKPICNPCI